MLQEFVELHLLQASETNIDHCKYTNKVKKIFAKSDRYNVQNNENRGNCRRKETMEYRLKICRDI